MKNFDEDLKEMLNSISENIYPDENMLENIESKAQKRLYREENKMKKCIVTVLGKDTVGIVAKVCTYLAENKINVLDISQTIIQGYFNMMVIVDVTELPKDFTQMCDEMEKLGDEIGVSIRCQREDIFEKMHRV
mgnify:CR=1 FL=1